MPGSATPASGTVRLFAALPLPAEIRDHLAAGLQALHGPFGGLRWTRPTGWHVTLAFLGRTPTDRLEDVMRALESAVGTTALPDRLQLREAGRFGRQVLLIRVADTPVGATEHLANRIRAALRETDLPVEERPVAPHLTLARARRRDRVTDAAVAAVDEVDIPSAGWRPQGVELWASYVGHGSASYETLASLPRPARSPATEHP